MLTELIHMRPRICYKYNECEFNCYKFITHVAIDPVKRFATLVLI